MTKLKKSTIFWTLFISIVVLSLSIQGTLKVFGRFTVPLIVMYLGFHTGHWVKLMLERDTLIIKDMASKNIFYWYIIAFHPATYFVLAIRMFNNWLDSINE